MRTAEVSRNTLETQIVASINIDGTGVSQLSSGLGFLDHMMDQIARHGMMDIKVEANGDSRPWQRSTEPSAIGRGMAKTYPIGAHPQ